MGNNLQSFLHARFIHFERHLLVQVCRAAYSEGKQYSRCRRRPYYSIHVRIDDIIIVISL